MQRLIIIKDRDEFQKMLTTYMEEGLQVLFPDEPSVRFTLKQKFASYTGKEE